MRIKDYYNTHKSGLGLTVNGLRLIINIGISRTLDELQIVVGNYADIAGNGTVSAAVAAEAVIAHLAANGISNVRTMAAGGKVGIAAKD